jgi:SPOR domain
MADNNFRGFRNRDPIAREDVDPTAGDLGDNPLADLARLIGQRDRVNDFDRGARYDDAVQTLDQPAPAEGQDWAADERYAEPGAPAQYADEDYAQPRLPDYPSDPAYAQHEREPAPVARYAEPADQYDDPHDERASEPRRRADERSRDTQYRDDARDDERSYVPAPRHREEAAPPPRAVARQAPALAPQSHDEEEYDEQWDDRGYDQSDIPDEYEDDTAGTSRRSGLAVVLAMLGLVLIGAAGAYAYRAMFGGAIMAPSLPPIIKPAEGPNKIVPNRSDAQQGASNQASGVNPGAPAQLVPREEQPVAVQPPPGPPKVLSQIPVPPAPSAPPAVAPAPDMNAPPAAPAAPKMTAPGQPQATAPMPGEPKKVHTIAIPSDQVGNNATAAPPPAAPAPAARPRATEPVTRPSAAPAPRGGANAPLSLVPGAQNAPPAAEPPPRTRAARAEPPPGAPVATAPAAPSTGGYAVQVTSQRSEVEAQTAFRELQAKFPSQLANHQPIIHRADLGEKGTYYRAMVGPFGSAEAAASLCSSLKAAGGSCIVQKN